MRRTEFNTYIQQADFVSFFNELGWDHVSPSDKINPITIEEVDYNIIPIADKQGFKVLMCETEEIPQHSVRKKIDTQLRRYFHNYILLFILKQSTRHLWMIPIKSVEKRDLIVVEYDDAEKADFLFGKIKDFSFELDEETNIIDVTLRVHKAFEVNSAKITKDFYSGFKKQHTSFANFIKGIDVEGDKQWYTSVMLNRLMFCYFIQKKGFLDFDEHYLRKKMEWTKEQRGTNQFFGSFYKGFLSHLFRGGLNSPKHDREFENIYGRIPYLNGGMFDEHELERQYQDIDIADDAFEELFNFFDKWRWHLDTRITASGKDINPDVLGYIFEQYINDRAQMGAYYTKEDITEYIGKNCIIPFLMDEVAKTSSKKHFTPGGFVWEALRNSGDRYIYDAVKKGTKLKDLPAEIAIGLDTTQPNLLERRKEWNKPTPEAYGLPTEIWRETIERRNRYFKLLNKIRNGEITQINDFITYNLDIRCFVEELLIETDDHHFTLHFYKALQSISILDPTCGSGAFLFAALNILEPLYELCITRMQEFNADNPLLFKDQLEEIDKKYRSNIQYFIYKSIILRNLYGVDIMHEATEIARLRLFLKMVAVVDVDRRAENLGLDPLPDIDFNIRCGNTLVGYATEEELDKALNYGDMFAKQDYKQKIEDEMQKVAIAYNRFKEIQLTQHEDMDAFKIAKNELTTRLKKLNEILDQQLYNSTTTHTNNKGGLSFEDWYSTHQPFHWVAEFYQIIKGNGGFDIIIGNPPYVEFTKVNYSLSSMNYKTLKCGNLYTYVVERSLSISNLKSKIGMIIPISSICTDRMIEYQNLLLNKTVWNSLYAERPSKLFTGAEVQLVISLINSDGNKQVYSSKYNKWGSEYRDFLFSNLSYILISDILRKGSFPKIGSLIEKSIVKKLLLKRRTIALFQTRKGNYFVSYRNAGGRYYKVVLNYEPIFKVNKEPKKSSTYQFLYFSDKVTADSICALMNSGLFFWYWINYSDTWHMVNREIGTFPIDLTSELSSKLALINEQLMVDFSKNSTERIEKRNKGKDVVEFIQFNARNSKGIIDKIDLILSDHYNLTEIELDFIINYDIKYRMGDELNEDN